MTSKPVLVTVPQSEANTGDRELLQELLAVIPKLTRLNCTHRFTGGYSECRVYLATAEYNDTTAPQPWIIKIGPLAELESENNAQILAKAHVKSVNIASKIEFLKNSQKAVLLLDYANFFGRTPLQLEAILKRPESRDAVAATVQVIADWIAEPTWKSSNVGQVIKGWTLNKLTKLPEAIQKSADYPIIYSPDFSEAYSNPIYYLPRDIKRRDIKAPYAFIHGDLNLRNVLFARDSDNALLKNGPVFIDFRYACTDQYAVVDLAKLEACLRYQCLPQIETMSSLLQTTALLASTRHDLQLSSLPEVCTDKLLQDIWHCIKTIRQVVQRIANEVHREDTETSYWAVLLSYGITYATYPSSPDLRILAYVDAAALFTQHLVERQPGNQYILSAHPVHSPPVVAESPPPSSLAQQVLLCRSIARGQALIIIGPGYGRTGGVDPFLSFLQRLHKKLTMSDAPPVSASVLLEALHKKRPRQDIQRAIREQTKLWTDHHDSAFAKLPWTCVVHWHMHALPYAALTNIGGVEPLRVETLSDVAQAMDRIAAGTRAYIAIHGDNESAPDNLALTSVERRQRIEALSLLARALEQRQQALSILFWKCEDLAIDDIMLLRDAICEGMTISVDSYYLSQLDDNARDSALHTLEVTRIRLSMTELAATIDVTGEGQEEIDYTTWATNGRTFTLTNLQRTSKGLVRLFTDSIVPIEAGRRPEAFLLGAPVTVNDFNDGRVVRRRVLDESILPAIKAALAESDREPRIVVLTGRAGCGISTLLCQVAVELHDHPVVIADTRFARGRKEWIEAGELVAEVSRATSSTVILIAEASDSTIPGIVFLLEGCAEKRGRLAVVIGGRRDSLSREMPSEAKRYYFNKIDISDHLNNQEWEALARIVRRAGFSAQRSVSDLAKRMALVGRLLPAIYEATDRQNRRFKEIVAYEYGLYARDALVQRAYRLICTFGAFGVALTQYWLLKALGNRGMSDVARILGALREDIVTQRDELAETGDMIIEPVHKIIADEIVNIATPTPTERFQDIERLLSTANLASKPQGLGVAKLLYKNGPLILWMSNVYSNEKQRQERIRNLFDIAFENVPIHPQVEIHLRQHFSLILRVWGDFEEALTQISIAQRLESENSATTHILGLVHEGRAVRAWRAYADTRDELSLARARADEREALEFFANVRFSKPFEEHGYESEARYYKRKYNALEREMTGDLREEAKTQVFQGLYLLRTAEARIPKASLKETARTKGHLLQLAGDANAALDQLLGAASSAYDMVRKLRLWRAAISVAIEAKRWADVRRCCEYLFSAGERDAALFLIADDSSKELGKSTGDRIRDFRESAEEYNREDVETQLRWAELSIRDGYFERAEAALRRADGASRDLSFLERDRVRGVVSANGQARRFRGRVRRLFRADEGIIRMEGDKEVFFRVIPDMRGQLNIGDGVTFNLAWRIRGFRAVDVRLDAATSTRRATRSGTVTK